MRVPNGTIGQGTACQYQAFHIRGVPAAKYFCTPGVRYFGRLPKFPSPGFRSVQDGAADKFGNEQNFWQCLLPCHVLTAENIFEIALDTLFGESRLWNFLQKPTMETDSKTTPLTLWKKVSIGLGLKVVIATGGILLLLEGNYQAGVASLGILVITFLPYFMNNLLHMKIPAELETFSIIFTYLALFLGEVHGFYVKYWWWDLALHTTSGLLGGMLGFLLVYVLNSNKKINFNMTPLFIALFAFMFTMSMGTLWEIFEFAVDTMFGLDMQSSSLQDTMSDLIVDCAGGLVISVMGYFYLARKTGSDHFLKGSIRKFVLANPRIFRKSIARNP